MTQHEFVFDSLSTLEEALAARIRQVRFDANLTQTELAKRLGVSPRSVQDWEAGKTIPGARSRRKLDRFIERIAA